VLGMSRRVAAHGLILPCGALLDTFVSEAPSAAVDSRRRLAPWRFQASASGCVAREQVTRTGATGRPGAPQPTARPMAEGSRASRPDGVCSKPC